MSRPRTNRWRQIGACAIAVLLAMFPGGSARAAAGMVANARWSIQQAASLGPTETYMVDLSCWSASGCVAVGGYRTRTGTELTTSERWNGKRWSISLTRNPPGISRAYLDGGVSCTSSTACVAVGYYEIGTGSTSRWYPLAERWNETRWSIQRTPNPAGATETYLEGVSCTSSKACMAVGYYDTMTGEHTLAERWNGFRWTIQPAPDPTRGSGPVLEGVSCASSAACTAVGYYQTGSHEVVLAERWNGRRWSIQPARNITGAPASYLMGISCTSPTACTAVGYYMPSIRPYATRTLAERWNGRWWSIERPANRSGKSDVRLDDVSCASGRACTAVGFSFNGAGAEQPLAERWNGTGWSIQATPRLDGTNRSDLRGVSCVSVSSCIAVGHAHVGGRIVALVERWRAGT